jgi:hypothetical protein
MTTMAYLPDPNHEWELEGLPEYDEVKMIEERLKLTIEKIIAEALQAQREACAEAASTTVRQTRLVAGEYVSCEVADELAQRTHAACMNAEVKP